MSRHTRTDLDFARDELMSHIHRCGVLKATPDQQQEWLKDTMGYMADRYPGLSPEELAELQGIGERFCAPVIPHGKGNTALSTNEDSHDDADELAGAA
ncbi:MAG TPA: hypothetical protein VFI96_02585 [Longimicrobiaceae bacterium]|nr:hypothetical protein [Longimicrobiaceae bacterium]